MGLQIIKQVGHYAHDRAHSQQKRQLRPRQATVIATLKTLKQKRQKSGGNRLRGPDEALAQTGFERGQIVKCGGDGRVTEVEREQSHRERPQRDGGNEVDGKSATQR